MVSTNLIEMPLKLSLDSEADDSDAEFVETDPSGRFGRYNEVLGKGACKKVYRAFDELEGTEVAWNQIKVSDFVRNPEELERLYSEVHLHKTLEHKNINNFYDSWVDSKNEHINIITELFTSGTLRQYRLKHKYVDLRALKNWSKQILEGLLYLHSHNPPIIHRDLKCDNIFVNGNQGEVKIGDVGVAIILRQAHSAHSLIGTPEFMAPELYTEDYNELVDIYAFGMCLLELVTFEYPYAECGNADQIYRKVISGVKPASLAKVKDPKIKSFIEKCIAKVSDRLSAKELLMDHFLQSEADHENIIEQSKIVLHEDCDTKKLDNAETRIDNMPDNPRDFSIEGQMGDPDTVFLKLSMDDTTGNTQNIHFPFDIRLDTAISVAREMVEELDLTEQDVPAIADMIESEIRSCSSLTDFADHYSDYLVDPQPESLSPSTDNISASLGSLSLESGCSSLEPIPFDGEDPTEKTDKLLQDDDDDDVDIIVKKLQLLIVEQKKELDELKKRHVSIINDILMKLSPETRQQVYNTCKLEILKACIMDKKYTYYDPSFATKAEDLQISANAGQKEQAAESSNPRNMFRHKFKTGVEYMTPNLGIAIILRNDSFGS